MSRLCLLPLWCCAFLLNIGTTNIRAQDNRDDGPPRKLRDADDEPDAPPRGKAFGRKPRPDGKQPPERQFAPGGKFAPDGDFPPEGKPGGGRGKDQPREPGRGGPPDGEGFGPPFDRPGPFGPGKPGDGGRFPQPGGKLGLPFRRPDLERLKQEDPELFALIEKDRELDRKTFDLGERVRRAPPNQREALQKELNSLLSEQFDVRQKRRELDVKRLEEQVQRLRNSLKKRQDSREQIIERRMKELTGQHEDADF